MNVIQFSLLHFRPFKPRNDIPLHKGEGGRQRGWKGGMREEGGERQGREEQSMGGREGEGERKERN